MSNFRNELFMDVVYLEHGADGTGSAPNDRLPIAAKADLFKAMDGDVHMEYEMIVEEAVTGSTALIVGNTGDPDGYIAAVDVTLATPGVYAGAGALLPNKPGAEDVALGVTGASTAGKVTVVRRGYRV